MIGSDQRRRDTTFANYGWPVSQNPRHDRDDATSFFCRSLQGLQTLYLSRGHATAPPCTAVTAMAISSSASLDMQSRLQGLTISCNKTTLGISHNGSKSTNLFHNGAKARGVPVKHHHPFRDLCTKFKQDGIKAESWSESYKRKDTKSLINVMPSRRLIEVFWFGGWSLVDIWCWSCAIIIHSELYPWLIRIMLVDHFPPIGRMVIRQVLTKIPT